MIGFVLKNIFVERPVMGYKPVRVMSEMARERFSVTFLITSPDKIYNLSLLDNVA